MGDCRWIHGNEDAIVHGARKPRYVDSNRHDLGELLAKEPVDIVLFDGCKPGVNNSVWACPEIEYVVWFYKNSSRCTLPSGWKLESRSLSHTELGGVTNGIFRCRVARRNEAPDLLWPSDPLAVSSYLRQVIDPTLGGPLEETRPDLEHRDLNTASGLLDWNKRFDKVLVPTVYSKEKWARRKLHAKELLSALDVPAEVQGKITGGIVNHFMDMQTPGKILTHVLRVILGERMDKKRPPNSPLVSEAIKKT